MTAVFKIDVRALRCANKSRARSNTARPTSARTRSYADAQKTVRGIDRSEIGDVPAQERDLLRKHSIASMACGMRIGLRRLFEHVHDGAERHEVTTCRCFTSGGERALLQVPAMRITTDGKRRAIRATQRERFRCCGSNIDCRGTTDASIGLGILLRFELILREAQWQCVVEHEGSRQVGWLGVRVGGRVDARRHPRLGRRLYGRFDRRR